MPDLKNRLSPVFYGRGSLQSNGCLRFRASSDWGLPWRIEALFFPFFLGEVTEWPNVTDSKSVVPETVPGVRIPPSPPLFIANGRE